MRSGQGPNPFLVSGGQAPAIKQDKGTKDCRSVAKSHVTRAFWNPLLDRHILDGIVRGFLPVTANGQATPAIHAAALDV